MVIWALTHSTFCMSVCALVCLCACLAAQEREILQKLAVMTEVAKKLVERQATEKPFGFLNIVFQKCREEEMQEDRRAQLLNFENDEMDEGKAERDKIRRELLACFEVCGTNNPRFSCRARPSWYRSLSRFIGLRWCSLSYSFVSPFCLV